MNKFLSFLIFIYFVQGYVQGMNFIVGFFLYHSEEYISFWLFTSLIEEYDLRQVYLTGKINFIIQLSFKIKVCQD